MVARSKGADANEAVERVVRVEAEFQENDKWDIRESHNAYPCPCH
jgi:hypothetical protein